VRLLARNDRFAVLAFRGTTSDFRTILTDIKIRFYRDKSGARTSTGFSEAYKLVQQGIAEAVDALEPSLPLYITGHSLGGALAAIASTRILPSDRIAACYTYGCRAWVTVNSPFSSGKFPFIAGPLFRRRAPCAFGVWLSPSGRFALYQTQWKMIQDPNTIAFLCSFSLARLPASKVFSSIIASRLRRRPPGLGHPAPQA